MPKNLRLRPVTLDDVDVLLAWRNDSTTRHASHSMDEVARDGHVRWLDSSIENPNRTLMIAEVGDVPVGAVRADRHESGVHELSWTVAPEARGSGLGKAMVAHFSSQFSGPIRAEVKAGNVASSRIAEGAGMAFVREDDGILHYERKTLNQ
ncbi:GNAT family N-acetyltransferase [Cupriavidus sp. CuC1]|uniref:GNAT family N-acetyltransferase n=1 Tax=Cupriavidus sp. CuC1 TaxID=3373131 RepID=UPI0037D77200